MKCTAGYHAYAEKGGRTVVVVRECDLDAGHKTVMHEADDPKRGRVHFADQTATTFGRGAPT